MPSDQLSGTIAKQLQTPGEVRNQLTANIHLPHDRSEALGRLEYAFDLTHQAAPLLKQIKAAVVAGKLPQERPDRLAHAALENGIISRSEFELIQLAQEVRVDTVQVDAFSLENYLHPGADQLPTSSIA